jgi:hypothetical protein
VVVSVLVGRGAIPIWSGAAVVVAAVVVVWQVVQPFDLYPRFLVAVLPGLGVGAGLLVAHWRPALVLVVVAVVAMATEGPAVWRAEAPNRQAAELVIAAEGAGLRTCAQGAGALTAYVREVTEARGTDLTGCDLWVRIGRWDRGALAQAREQLPHEGTIDGRYEVLSRVPLEDLLGREPAGGP